MLYFCGPGDGFQLQSAAYLCEEQSSKTSFVCGINQTANALLARRTVSAHMVALRVRVDAHACVCVRLAKLGSDVFAPQSSSFANL